MNVDLATLQRFFPRAKLDAPLKQYTAWKIGGPADALLDGSALDGKAARKALRAGVPLRESDLLRPVVVERASMVTIAYEVPGITLSLKGKAMEAGALGDAVSVQNLTSKRMIQAVVTGPGRVRVGDAPPVGKVAAVNAPVQP